MMMNAKAKEHGKRKFSSIDESSTTMATTGSSSSSAAAAVRPADDNKDNIKSSSNTANTKVVAGEEKSDDYNGCLTTDETGTGLPDSIAAKEEMHNDDDDAYIRSLSQAQEATFPQQLMDLIESETTDDNAVIIRGQKAIEWLSTGDKFIIRDKKALESHVLPKYFKHETKFNTDNIMATTAY